MNQRFSLHWIVGYLNSITSPVHRHLLESDHINCRVRKQYINDIKEKWMDYSDPLRDIESLRCFTAEL